jgi:hypothetical protein
MNDTQNNNTMTNAKAKNYLCIAPNTWGRGASEEEAKRNAHVYSNAKPHTILIFSHDQYSVDCINGSVTYDGEAPTIVRKVTRKK